MSSRPNKQLDPSGLSSPSPIEAPRQDTPEALRPGGFLDDEAELLAEERPAAQALPGASAPQAIGRLYGQYWLTKGQASRSEFYWGMLYCCGSSLGLLALTLWMGRVVETGQDQVSSLFRTLYMLLAYLAPAWLLLHLGPALSLLRRFRNGQSRR